MSTPNPIERHIHAFTLYVIIFSLLFNLLLWKTFAMVVCCIFFHVPAQMAFLALDLVCGYLMVAVVGKAVLDMKWLLLGNVYLVTFQKVLAVLIFVETFPADCLSTHHDSCLVSFGCATCLSQRDIPLSPFYMLHVIHYSIIFQILSSIQLQRKLSARA